MSRMAPCMEASTISVWMCEWMGWMTCIVKRFECKSIYHLTILIMPLIRIVCYLTVTLGTHRRQKLPLSVCRRRYDPITNSCEVCYFWMIFHHSLFSVLHFRKLYMSNPQFSWGNYVILTPITIQVLGVLWSWYCRSCSALTRILFWEKYWI